MLCCQLNRSPLTRRSNISDLTRHDDTYALKTKFLHSNKGRMVWLIGKCIHCQLYLLYKWPSCAICCQPRILCMLINWVNLHHYIWIAFDNWDKYMCPICCNTSVINIKYSSNGVFIGTHMSNLTYESYREKKSAHYKTNIRPKTLKHWKAIYIYI